MFTTIKSKYNLNALFFVIGFIFDLITLNRIDQGFLLIQQAGFLVCILVLIFIEFGFQLGLKLPAFILKYKTFAMHFLMGSLLSAFVIFYFLSSSGLTSFAFVLAIVSLLILNELPQFQSISLPFKVTLFSICLVSYLSYTTPIWLGHIGLAPLLLSAIIFILITTLNTYILQKLTLNDKFITKNLTIPSLCTLTVFLGLYFTRVIPPVPLSIKKIGIYRSIEKKEKQYILGYKKHPWKFWLSGEQNFHYQSGDKVFCFAGIFSPTTFSDQVKFNWYVKQNNQWVLSDSIAIKISGGRDKGFRAYSFKSKVSPGQWRVKILTLDNREIGRTTFYVSEGSSPYSLAQETY